MGVFHISSMLPVFGSDSAHFAVVFAVVPDLVVGSGGIGS